MFLITRSRAYPQGYTVFVRRHALGQWRDNCLCRPCNAGGPARVGGPCANHQKNFSRHSCRLCIVVLMDAAQFRLLRIVRSLGRGDPMTMFAAFAGGPEFLVTPLLWVCLSWNRFLASIAHNPGRSSFLAVLRISRNRLRWLVVIYPPTNSPVSCFSGKYPPSTWFFDAIQSRIYTTWERRMVK